MPFKNIEDRKLWNKEYYKKNKKKLDQKHKQYYKEHVEETKIYRKKYWKENSEYIKIKQRKRRENNPDAVRAIQKKYYYSHREKCLTDSKKYKSLHIEQYRAYGKKRYQDHPEVFLEALKKHLTRIGKPFDLNWKEMKYAIMSWSKTVKKRDNHKCTWCNSTQNLKAHHIWHKAYCPESALDPDNGITLCHDCHKEQHRLDNSFS
jgi:hypothetical protein